MRFAIAALIATNAIAQEVNSAQGLDWNSFNENGVLGSTGPATNPNTNGSA